MGSLAAVVAFGAVFVLASLGLSAVACTGLLLLEPRLRGSGPWVERRMAVAALLLPPLLALALVAALAADSALALATGTDHCLAHSHHLHLCLAHGGPWASRPWALMLVASAGTFVVVRFALSFWSHLAAQRAAERLRSLGTSLEVRGCHLVPSAERFAFTAGLLSPVVLFSTAAWEALQPQERRAILAHECAHVAHGDLWRRAALGVAASFGAPLLAQRALAVWELAAERICDREAALAVDEPATVASAMLALVRIAPSPLAPEGAAFAAAAHVEARIESLLGQEPDGAHSARRLALLLLAASLFLALSGALFSGPLHHALETLLG